MVNIIIIIIISYLEKKIGKKFLIVKNKMKRTNFNK